VTAVCLSSRTPTVITKGSLGGGHEDGIGRRDDVARGDHDRDSVYGAGCLMTG
jgi:hypothetical protein